MSDCHIAVFWALLNAIGNAVKHEGKCLKYLSDRRLKLMHCEILKNLIGFIYLLSRLLDLLLSSHFFLCFLYLVQSNFRSNVLKDRQTGFHFWIHCYYCYCHQISSAKSAHESFCISFCFSGAHYMALSAYILSPCISSCHLLILFSKFQYFSLNFLHSCSNFWIHIFSLYFSTSPPLWVILLTMIWWFCDVRYSNWNPLIKTSVQTCSLKVSIASFDLERKSASIGNY